MYCTKLTDTAQMLELVFKMFRKLLHSRGKISKEAVNQYIFRRLDYASANVDITRFCASNITIQNEENNPLIKRVDHQKIKVLLVFICTPFSHI